MRKLLSGLLEGIALGSVINVVVLQFGWHTTGPLTDQQAYLASWVVMVLCIGFLHVGAPLRAPAGDV